MGVVKMFGMRSAALALSLTAGVLVIAGCSSVEPAPDRDGIFTFGEENWLEAPGWVVAQSSEVEMVGADFGIAENEGENPGTQIFIELYESEYSGESNRDKRDYDISTLWNGDTWFVGPLEVNGHQGHGLSYEIIEPDRVVEEYYFDGESSIYRVLVETPLDDSPSEGLQAAHKILTEHTVLNDGDR